MYAVALRPGSWPPSPGFEPWAILISSWSARARYAAVTPNRADATCLIRASWRRPSGPGAYHAGSSPPSPVFAAPPARWMPIVSAWCASGDRAPTLIAETTKRRTMRAGVLDLVERRRGAAPGGRAARRAGPPGRTAASRERRPVARERGIDAVRIVGRRERRDLGGDLRARTGGPRRRRGSAREPGVREARLATRRGAARWPPRPPRAGAAVGRGRAKVVRPGQSAAVGKQRATTAASRSMTSMSAPPMYEATALMPIRARVLRRPASKADTRPVDGRRPA